MESFHGDGPERQEGDVSDDELRRQFRQHVMADLSRDDGLLPEYRDDISSPQEFEANLLSMPLIAIWGEAEIEEGRAFSISINPLLVEASLADVMHPNDPWFKDETIRIITELKGLVQNSLVATMQKTGMSARQICDDL